MPIPPKKRRRPYLRRQAKRRCVHPPYTPLPSSPTPSTISITRPPPPPSLLTLPDDVFQTIIAHLQSGAHHRGKTLHSSKHAFPLAQLSTAGLARYSTTLHTIDPAFRTQRDPHSPPLLKEHQPPHIRNLITLAKHNLRVLRLPRYEHSQIGAEAVLPVIHQCTALTHLSFVDCGRVDRQLTKSIFVHSLQAVDIERPSSQLVASLAKSSAKLKSLKLVYIPYSAMDNVIQLLTLRGSAITHLSLAFDIRSIKVVEDSCVKSAEASTIAELRRFLNVVYGYLVDWLPALNDLQLFCSDLRDLEHSRALSGEVLQRGLGVVSDTVNDLRLNSGMLPTDLTTMSVCGRSLYAIPGLLTYGQIRVRLPGYELRYDCRDNRVVKPVLTYCQMTTILRTLDTDTMRLTGELDTLDIGDDDMVRAFDDLQDDISRMISNAKSLKRIIVRLSLDDPDFAVLVMKYVTCAMRCAPWVEEVEISHEIVLYHDKPQFSDMITSMASLQCLHLSTPLECLTSCAKSRISGFVKHLPKVLRLVADRCKMLEVFYCERIGEARVVSAKKSRQELIRKLGEIDVVIDGRLTNVDCTSLKALVATWAEQIKQDE